MKLYPIALILAGLCCSLGIQSQELSTDKVKFNLNALSADQNAEAGRSVPAVEIISPADKKGDLFLSSDSEIDLIGQVNLKGQISFITVNSKIAEVNDRGMFTYTLQLDPGENHVKMAIVDKQNNLTEREIIIEYVPPVISLADRITAHSKYYGLIIGIDNYQDENIPDLDNPIKDAEKVYNTLITHYTFEEENIWLLKDATRGDMIEALDELAQTVSPDDNLLIFYAGHGWWDEEAENGYWIPSDADSRVKTNWFRNSALVDYLTEINSKHTLLIADACFGGSIFKTRAAFPTPEKAYEKLYELPSRKAMTSGTLTEVPDRSAFTRFLVERLRANNDKYLSSEQLYSSFRIAVINNSDVVPRYGEIANVGDEGGDFIFIKKN